MADNVGSSPVLVSYSIALTTAGAYWIVVNVDGKDFDQLGPFDDLQEADDALADLKQLVRNSGGWDVREQ